MGLPNALASLTPHATRARFACRAPRSLVHTSQAQAELTIFLSKSQHQ
ncbi:hypothetical protein Schulenberg_057 [Escherichia phage Schulenburg]|nr:hypothetical protein Schulenberg_057 [Escherichia phage Schulenburg]